VLEEADETVFRLELMRDAELFPEAKLREVVQKAKGLTSSNLCDIR
jgi:hypothetical protein